ncbi:MAG: type II toxin-antitoxin system RelE/ParE family toxin [Pirellulales bacterium]|nr:type II toxin-antitoxin system RelE/ParE family toxin [Pirellulales bacterium]
MDEIADYLSDRHPSAAVRVLENIFAKFSLLSQNPLLGELRSDLPKQPRCFSAGNYIILYHPISDGIEIARVLHGARDLGAILEE